MQQGNRYRYIGVQFQPVDQPQVVYMVRPRPAIKPGDIRRHRSPEA